MPYRIVGADSSFTTINGSVSTPIMTLADEYGGRSQIAMDDHCYVLYNKKYGTNVYAPVYHWYEEAVYALRVYPKIETLLKIGLIETAGFIKP